MWDGNYAGPWYGFRRTEKLRSCSPSLGGIVGDTAVWRAMSEYAKAWRFKHPSPWDYAFFMNNALHQDLGWFWNYWLFTTESVDGIDPEREDIGPAHYRHGASERTDAVAGDPEGRVRVNRSGDQTDAEQQNDGCEHSHRNVSGQCLVSGQPHLQRGSRFRRARDQ